MPNTAPTISNLNGDGVAFAAGGSPVRLDAGTNAAITDPDPFGFVVNRVGTGLSGGPLFVVPVPDASGRVYVVEKAGTIRILDPATGTIAPTAFLNVASQVSTSGEQGLLGFALAPNFASSGIFYIYMTNLNGDNEVRRYSTLPGSLDQADPGTANRILLSPHPGATNHNAGWIAFGPDGFLYIALGDGANSPNAQSLNTILGKILRIDPSFDAFPADADRDYAIPAGNPFAGPTPGLDEIWALGLRNPFRASFDSLTGDLWIGDVGQNLIEEVDFNPAGQGGLNFGWDQREGTQQFNGPNSPAFTPPVTEYGHGTGPFQGNSVTGGLVYRGPIAGLDGHYVFGDFFDELWSVPASSLVQGSTLPSSSFILRDTAFTPNAGTINQITSFATDPAGNLYITDLGGEVFRVQPSAAPNFAGGRLTVNISAGEVPAEDRLGFATGGAVTLSDGTNVDSQVRVGGILVGTVAPGGTGAGGAPLLILFSSGATQALITTLIQAVTYSNADPTPTEGTRTVTISVNDGAGIANGGQDTAVVTTTVNVSDGGVVLTGTTGNDMLVGGPGPDILRGLAGNDVLIGAGGVDNTNGGPGDDIHYVDSPDDIAVEAAGQGRDAVYASANYILREGQELELLLTQNRAGTAPLALGGNSLANFIHGNDGANRLNGNGGNDVLIGYAGDDILIGGSGIDHTNGGPGDDVHYVDSVGDLVVEAAGQGRDSVYASTSYFLRNGQEIELLLTQNRNGTTAIDLMGNSIANNIQGNAGANALDGMGGSDILVGLGGPDRFGFSTALGPTNVDILIDFVPGLDIISVDNAVFAGLPLGPLAAGAFRTGTAAADADDRIIYNPANGALLFDQDGLGGAAAVQFATLQPGLSITNADFIVV